MQNIKLVIILSVLVLVSTVHAQLYDARIIVDYGGRPQHRESVSAEKGIISHSETGPAENFSTASAWFGTGFAKVLAAGRARHSPTEGIGTSDVSSVADLSFRDDFVMVGTTQAGLAGSGLLKFSVDSDVLVAVSGLTRLYGTARAEASFALQVADAGVSFASLRERIQRQEGRTTTLWGSIQSHSAL